MPCSVRLAFRHWLGLQILNLPNRRVRTRTHGGVGGGSCEASPYPDNRAGSGAFEAGEMVSRGEQGVVGSPARRWKVMSTLVPDGR